ncbi:MAG: hypothetical protein ACREN8_13205, partial [Candidatus Dormibacteraceae bacterium]
QSVSPAGGNTAREQEKACETKTFEFMGDLPSQHGHFDRLQLYSGRCEWRIPSTSLGLRDLGWKRQFGDSSTFARVLPSSG